MSNPNTLDFDMSLSVYNSGRDSCATSVVDCADYHYIRPVLRQVGVVTSASTNEEFFSDAIASHLAGISQPEVTISGTADYSWLLENSPLVASLPQAETTRITVEDACGTPTISSVMASKALTGVEVASVSSDIRRSLSREQQDLIVTDAFLTQFPDSADRLSILRSWYSSLKIGGLAVTTVQIRSASITQPSDRGLSRFVDNTVKAIEDSPYPDALRLQPQDARDAVLRYAQLTRSRTYESEEELVSEVQAAGLTVKEITPLTVFSQGLQKTLFYRGVILEKPETAK